jgi:two-component system response regulator HydG
LYYRLQVIELHIPPLRARPEELPGLARDLLVQTAARFGQSTVGYTARALDCLLNYHWPGNIRELEHVIEHACLVATGPEVDVEDLPAVVRRSLPVGTTPARRPLAERDRAYIRAVIERHQGNRRRAAEELGFHSPR